MVNNMETRPTDYVYLTVGLPIRNEEAHINATLEALASQDFPRQRYELIVVDGQSTDGTRAVVEDFIRRHPEVNVRLMDNPGMWSSRARNIGIRAAGGRLIAVIDGHVHVPNNQLFASMERLQGEHHALCLARPAPLLVPSQTDAMSYWIAVARGCWLAHSRNSYIYRDCEGFVDPTSSGFAYHRDVFDRVGCFDESFDAAEDCEFHHRLKQAGIQAYTSPDLTIYSFPRETLSSLFRQMVRYGTGRARLARKHPEAFTKETLIPPAVLLLFAAGPLAVLAASWLPLLAVAYMAAMAIYWLVVLVTSIVLAVRRRRVFAGLYIAVAIWTTHIGLGYGFLKAMVVPSATEPILGCDSRPDSEPTEQPVNG
jgi:succinoglycan biosynthesis protein ExoA